MKGRAGVLFFLLWFFAAIVGIQPGAAQTHQTRLEQGIRLYRAGQWTEAALELRRSQRDAADTGQLATSLYWLSLAEFSLGEYEAALRDINEMQRIAPAGLRLDDALLYKGRTLYYLERPGEALPNFRSYGEVLNRRNSPGVQAEKLVLAYWMGECFYALGQQDQAEAQFTLVVNARPRSEKYEAAAYRLAMLQRNKVQAEILDMLGTSYTEHLRTVEEYQRLLADAEAQIHALEASRNGTSGAVGGEQAAPSWDPGPEHSVQRIRDLKAEAEKLRAELPPQ